MGALEKLKELKDQLSEEQAKPIEDQVLDGDEEELVEEEKPEKKPEEKPADKSEEQKPTEEKPVEKTPADYAKERREKRDRETALTAQVAEANRIAEAYRRQLEAAQQPRQTDNDPEPNKAENRESWLEWKDRQIEKKLAATEALAQQASQRIQQQEQQRKQEQTIQSARDEAANYENDFRKSAPDYDAVKGQYINMLAASIKLQNPKITNDQLVKSIDHMILTRLSGYINDGYENPVAALYDDVRQYYTPSKVENDNEAEKPDLSVVAKNRARNAGTASSGGRGGGELTLATAAKLPAGEFAKLPIAEKRKLMYGK